MSENENLPPSPSSQTSSVPLKKETVRVTLNVGDAPPSATVPMAPPAGPPVPPIAPTPIGGAPRPPAPAPTIPLRTAGAPPISPAPTIRLAPTAAPAVGLPPAGLPKATVQLQKPAVPLGGPVALQTAELDEDESEEGGEGLTSALSAIGLIAALVVLFFQVKTANTWINAEDNANKGSWAQVFE